MDTKKMMDYWFKENTGATSTYQEWIDERVLGDKDKSYWSTVLGFFCMEDTEAFE